MLDNATVAVFSKKYQDWDVSEADTPVFSFVDGPLIRALKSGDSVLLRNIDTPDQAVIECSNSALDISRIFHTTESEASNKIALLPSTAIIATVRVSPSQSLRAKISSALTSRVTRINTDAYSSGS